MRGIGIFIAGTICCGVVLGLALPAAAGDTVSRPQGELPPPGALDGPQARELIDRLGDRLRVVDVRTPAEFAAGHLAQALLLPVQEIQKDVSLVPTDRPLLLLCRSGGRAAYAYEQLRKAHPENREIWYLDGAPEYREDGTYTFH